jgi:hypothetical protein
VKAQPIETAKKTGDLSAKLANKGVWNAGRGREGLFHALPLTKALGVPPLWLRLRRARQIRVDSWAGAHDCIRLREAALGASWWKSDCTGPDGTDPLEESHPRWPRIDSIRPATRLWPGRRGGGRRPCPRG